VGGGPAGMEAARVAAKRGHDVTLYEKGSFLGGLTPVAAIVKDLETEDITLWIKYLKTQLKKEGVKVHMKTEVTPELVKQVNPDALVIATGPAHKKIDLPGAEPPKFVMAEKMHNMSKTALKFFTSKQLEKLSRIYQPGMGKSVVIMGGTLHGYELAEFLVKRGRKVTVVHNGPEEELGDRMTIDDIQLIGPWFKQKHVSIWTDAEYKEITKKGLKMAQHGRLVYEIEGKQVIDTLDLVPDQKSIDQLSEIIDETHVIGSCKEPGLMVDAVRDGVEVGLAL
jgi:NADPH-dependent 2,4-dienoyl-CoA reductase/sulfur reductase-like enzyme